MKHYILAGLLVAGLTLPAAALATPPGGMPDQSLHGLCTAYEANENGRENGNAGDAPPFQDLQDRAEENNQTVEEFCQDVDHPSSNGNGGGDGGGPPSDAGSQGQSNGRN